jgi:hypothetical protein
VVAIGDCNGAAIGVVGKGGIGVGAEFWADDGIA